MGADAGAQTPPPDPPQRGGENGGGADPAGAPDSSRYGPLRVERVRKDDGRGLILFSLQPDARAGGG